AYVGESVTQPDKYYRNNVVGTLTLLEAMVAANIKAFVFSSTCATYGIPQQIPMTEEHPQVPINPYGATKLMVERILQDFDVAYGLKSVIFRYFNAAGADPDGMIGEDHNPETHLIP
ncbi:MAG: NAD-dependent epimerase/dehydratase family protein, partial [Pseudanabaena sp.]